MALFSSSFEPILVSRDVQTQLQCWQMLDIYVVLVSSVLVCQLCHPKHLVQVEMSVFCAQMAFWSALCWENADCKCSQYVDFSSDDHVQYWMRL